MNIYIRTNASNGHLILYLINSNGVKMLSLRDIESNGTMLVPGQTYRFEWHVWSPHSAAYEVEATIEPANEGFQRFTWNRAYDEPTRI